MLKIIEGTVANAPAKVKGKEGTPIDTKNILFICGGAFVGLDEVILEREKNKNNENSLGFGAKVNSKNEENPIGEILSKVITPDLEDFGLIPELIGRIPVVATLDDLDEKMLIEILSTPKDAIIKQYQKMFAMDNVTINFNKASLKAIARKALELKCGARGLRTILEELLLDVMFKLPNLGTDMVNITERHVKEGGRAILTDLGHMSDSTPPTLTRRERKRLERTKAEEPKKEE